MVLFQREHLCPGHILHSRGTSLFSRLIRRAIGSWGSHDAIVVSRGGVLWIGESVSPTARLTALEEYERSAAAGKCKLRVYRPAAGTAALGLAAATWWTDHILNSPYDWPAIPKLLLKGILGDRWGGQAGLEWANWCTEGVANAWREGAGLDCWKNANPTPRTTEKRLAEGALVDVTCWCLRT